LPLHPMSILARAYRENGFGTKTEQEKTTQEKTP
jgi:hypothetical protein